MDLTSKVILAGSLNLSWQEGGGKLSDILTSEEAAFLDKLTRDIPDKSFDDEMLRTMRELLEEIRKEAPANVNEV